MDIIKMKPIAFVVNERIEIKDDEWGSVISEIHLDKTYNSSAFDGIEDFSHLQILFHFHKTDKFVSGAAHPRGNTNWPKVGIFAQRKKSRPNHIGSTIVRLVKRKGSILQVKYLDAIHGTPILDIKPVMKEFLPKVAIHQPKWSTELMKNYWD